MNEKKVALGIPFINDSEKRFMDYFNENWTQFIDDPRLADSQIGIGSRLRPRLVYWSFASANGDSPLTEDQYKRAASLAACMELIHKSTILLDDWIDKDDARHGTLSFHVKYTPELTVMYALNILSKALIELNNIFFKCENSEMYHICMNTITETMRLMTQGEIYELTLSSEELFSVEKIKNIIQLETAELLSNSLLMGYYGNGGNNANVATILKKIGHNCGYIFQCMNDLEPFCQKEDNILHKGSYNLDFDRERKNIGIAMLHQIANKKDRLILESKPSYDSLVELFNKYKIIDFFLKDLVDVKLNNKLKISELCELGISNEWGESFALFIDYVVAVCQNRLKKNNSLA